VIDQAEAGKILIVTSALTLAEVTKLKGKPAVPQEDAETITRAFKRNFLEIREVDRSVAELARDYMWRYKRLKHKDAIHIATAATYHITILDTFDEGLIRLDGKLGNPVIRIGVPDILSQGNLFSETEGEE